jgi:hypothetical protein
MSKPLFKENDHAEASISGLAHYGHVKESRKNDRTGWEYKVDFYSFLLGEVWIAEPRLTLTVGEKNPKKLCVLIQHGSAAVLRGDSNGMYRKRDDLRQELDFTELAFLREDDVEKTLNVIERQANYVITVILEKRTFNDGKTVAKLREKGALFIYEFSGETAQDLIDFYETSVRQYKEYADLLRWSRNSQ